MKISFKGKIALVTGGARGIGYAIVRQMIECGAKVIAIDKETKQLECLKNEIPSVDAISLDLCDYSATKKCVESLGNIDLLVNNAGVAILKPLVEVTEKHIDEIYCVNFKAMVNLTQIVTANLMKRKAQGAIVNISSILGMRGIENLGIYCSSKGAVNTYTKACALEFGPHGIRVNSVNPTLVLTEMGFYVFSKENAKKFEQKIPLRRLPEVDEVANAVVYLLSDKASSITGHSVPVDGGGLATV